MSESGRGVKEVLGDWWECVLGIHESTLRIKEAIEGSTGAILLNWAKEREVRLAQSQSLAEELRSLMEVEPISEWGPNLLHELQEIYSLIESLLSLGGEVMEAVRIRQDETWRRLKTLSQGRKLLEGYRSYLRPEGRLVDLREPEG